MGRIADLFFGKPREPLPPASPRIQAVEKLLLEHRATLSTRVPVNASMWASWARSLSEEIVKTIDPPGDWRGRRYPDLETELSARLNSLASEFDHRDHERTKGGKGTGLQLPCHQLTEIADDLLTHKDDHQKPLGAHSATDR